MKKIRLDEYLKKHMKKDVAAQCGVSPAMISKACAEMEAGYRDYYVAPGPNSTKQLMRKNAPWTVIVGR